ncbi:hypothetical protein BD770DRAFT_439092 [Pilaira anomala]|nr:hypothetical protein BD770DRAFT_439092 [Pilaira anomala]
MLPHWFSSWYPQQQVQSQEPFNDQYEAADEEGDWVQVITPSVKRRQPPQPTQEMNIPVEVTHHETTAVTEPVVKGLSRQERRAKARFAVKDKKKQARTAAMVMNRNRPKGLNGSTCLPPSVVSIDH